LQDAALAFTDEKLNIASQLDSLVGMKQAEDMEQMGITFI